MKRFLYGLVLGLLLGGSGMWYYAMQNRSTLQYVQDKVKSAATDVYSDIKAENLKQEISKQGVVIREKARQTSAAIMDTAGDAAITARIKARYVADSDLSVFNLSVSTSGGVVTLSGRVANHDQLSKAIKLALDFDSVRKVYSTVEIIPSERR